MAFIRRQNAAEESTADDLQNVNNAKRQLIEPSIAEYENYEPLSMSVLTLKLTSLLRKHTGLWYV